MSRKNNYVVIMAGGIGSRFWPISRSSNPKQFLDILGIGKSLLQLTYERFLNTCPAENIYIVTNEAYTDLVKDQLPNLKKSQILSEPARKNTAPCIAYFSYKIHAKNPNARVVVAPSDHIILKEEVFTKVIDQGLSAVTTNDYLITLGIKPSRPDTGYGYIQYAEKSTVDGIYKVKTFTEKPSLEIAETFLKSGDFLWNSGMFIWNVKSIIKAFAMHLPEINDLFKEGKSVYNTPKEKKFIEKTYDFCPNTSIDYGIMEKAQNVYVLPADFGWSDLGTWSSLFDINTQKDGDNNVKSNKNIITYDTSNCMIVTEEEKLVVIQGLDDYIVVDTHDVLLVTPKSEEQNIKQITTDIKKIKKEHFL